MTDLIERLRKYSAQDSHLTKAAVPVELIREAIGEIISLRNAGSKPFDLEAHLAEPSREHPLLTAAAVNIRKNFVAPVDTDLTPH